MSRSIRFSAPWTFTLFVALTTMLFTACRKSGPQAGQDYAAAIQSERLVLQALEGERVPVRLILKNLGRCDWDPQAVPPIFLSYHLMDPDHTLIQFDNRRIPLPGRIESGRSAQMVFDLRTPLQKGTYVLEFDLVREGEAWFEDYDSNTLEVRLQVNEKIWSDNKSTRFNSSVPEINQIYKLIRITLEENQTEFKGHTGWVQGFAPGKNYPQIWLRDASTIVSASRYFYEAPWLSSWLEEHLLLQKDNGSLWDWFDSRGETSKNTTETDQEASAVQAAYEVYSILGEAWLQKKIAGKSIIDRLEAALQYVLLYRMDENTGLVLGAHTADWGDVDFIDTDDRAVNVDARTHWTVDIYDQSMVYDACIKLSRLLQSLKENDRSQQWENMAAALRSRTQQRLWQEGRGFFAVHRHMDDLVHDFDEDDIFAMGGNVQAVLSGMADSLQAHRIFEAALSRQSTYGISTVSGTLLPPYPKKAFAHPMLDDPFEYQNGAQWDWFGARLIFAMFEMGYAKRAQEKLVEILKKNLLNRGFFEWDNREGVGSGSDTYCGSAGSLSQALISGYFGIFMDTSAPRVEPKLGWASGTIHLYQPANNTFIDYRYLPDSENEQVEMHINSNISASGIIKILIPDRIQPVQNDRERSLQVMIDGKAIPYRIEARKRDFYVVLETKLNDRIIKLILNPPIINTHQ